ncbi:MAG: IclR family transcriptional regulator [Kiritimatiellaeota bacterium]|nr:IclR family transcriptional regulator [Kiritimatiellota bacterium]
MNKKRVSYDVPGLRAGLQVLRVLCEAPTPLGQTDLCQASGLNKHMVYRCLQTLLSEGMVVETGDGPKYEPSLLAFHYFSLPVARMTITRAATEPLRALWEDLNECVYLGVLHEDRILYLIHHEGGREIRSGGGRVGGSYCLHADGAGKVLAAYADDAVRERLLAKGLEKLTSRTHTGRKAFLADLARVRQQGFAVDREEYIPGVICFGAPLFDYAGAMAGAICCSVLTIHYSMDELESRIGPKVLETARRISATMGWVK